MAKLIRTTLDELDPAIYSYKNIGFWNYIKNMHFDEKFSETDSAPIAGWDKTESSIQELFRIGSYDYVRSKFGLTAGISTINTMALSLDTNGHLKGDMDITDNGAYLSDMMVYLRNTDTGNILYANRLNHLERTFNIDFGIHIPGTYVMELHTLNYYHGQIYNLREVSGAFTINTDLVNGIQVTNSNINGKLNTTITGLVNIKGYSIHASSLQLFDVTNNLYIHAGIYNGHNKIWDNLKTGIYQAVFSIDFIDKDNNFIHEDYHSNQFNFIIPPTIKSADYTLNGNNLIVNTNYEMDEYLPNLNATVVLLGDFIQVDSKPLTNRVEFHDLKGGVNYEVYIKIEYSNEHNVAESVNTILSDIYIAVGAEILGCTAVVSNKNIQVNTTLDMHGNSISSGIIRLVDVVNQKNISTVNYANVVYFNNIDPGTYNVTVELSTTYNGVLFNTSYTAEVPNNRDNNIHNIIISKPLTYDLVLSYNNYLELSVGTTPGLGVYDEVRKYDVLNSSGNIVYSIYDKNSENLVLFPELNIVGEYRIRMTSTYTDSSQVSETSIAFSNFISIGKPVTITSVQLDKVRSGQVTGDLHLSIKLDKDNMTNIDNSKSWVKIYNKDTSFLALTLPLILENTVSLPINNRYYAVVHIEYINHAQRFIIPDKESNTLLLVVNPEIEIHSMKYDRVNHVIHLSTIARYNLANDVTISAIEIIDLAGNIITTHNLKQGVDTLSFSTDKYPDGIYRVRLTLSYYDGVEHTITKLSNDIVVQNIIEAPTITGRIISSSKLYFETYFRHGTPTIGGKIQATLLKKGGIFSAATYEAFKSVAFKENMIFDNLPYGDYKLQLDIPYYDNTGAISHHTYVSKIMALEREIIIDRLEVTNDNDVDLHVISHVVNDSNCVILQRHMDRINLDTGRVDRIPFIEDGKTYPTVSGNYLISAYIKYLLNGVEKVVIKSLTNSVKFTLPIILSKPDIHINTHGLIEVTLTKPIPKFYDVYSHTLTLYDIDTGLILSSPANVVFGKNVYTFTVLTNNNVHVYEDLIYHNSKGNQEHQHIFSSTLSFSAVPQITGISVNVSQLGNMVINANWLSGGSSSEVGYIEIYDNTNNLIRRLPCTKGLNIIDLIGDLDGLYYYGLAVDYTDNSLGLRSVQTPIQDRVPLNMFLFPTVDFTNVELNSHFSITVDSTINATAKQWTGMTNMRSVMVSPVGDNILASKDYEDHIEFSTSFPGVVRAGVLFDITFYGGKIPILLTDTKDLLLSNPITLLNSATFYDPEDKSVHIGLQFDIGTYPHEDIANDTIEIINLNTNRVVKTLTGSLRVSNVNSFIILTKTPVLPVGVYKIKYKGKVSTVGGTIDFELDSKATVRIFQHPTMSIDRVVINDNFDTVVFSTVNYHEYRQNVTEGDVYIYKVNTGGDTIVSYKLFDPSLNFGLLPKGTYYAGITISSKIYGKKKELTVVNDDLTIVYSNRYSETTDSVIDKSKTISTVEFPSMTGFQIGISNDKIIVPATTISLGDFVIGDIIDPKLRLIDHSGNIIASIVYDGSAHDFYVNNIGLYKVAVAYTIKAYPTLPAHSETIISDNTVEVLALSPKPSVPHKPFASPIGLNIVTTYSITDSHNSFISASMELFEEGVATGIKSAVKITDTKTVLIAKDSGKKYTTKLTIVYRGGTVTYESNEIETL